MGVLENEQHRLSCRQANQLEQQRLESLRPLALGLQPDLAVAVLERQAEKRGDERRGLPGVLGALAQQRLQLVELLVGGISRDKTGGSPELLYRGVERAVGVVGRTLVAEPKIRLV